MFKFNVKTPFIVLSGLVILGLTQISCSSEAEKYVDEISIVQEKLQQERTATLEDLEQGISAQKVERLIDLGAWAEAENYINKMEAPSLGRKYVSAKLQFKKHQYEQAEVLINQILEEQPAHRDVQLLKAELEIQAWRLDEADAIASSLLMENKNDAKAGIIRGKVELLNRNYAEAARWGKEVQKWDPLLADGYLLEAESLFWDQDPAAAEPALKKALEINPFNADARFSYGYAVWRRVDATQLENMAAQWNMALQVNPMHYLTHWHYGNGHTNLTYADYVHPSDEEVREKLKAADPLVSQDKMEEAIQITRTVEKEYPESVLPEMMRGSLYYMYYSMDRNERLDSAVASFNRILNRKQNYGPAHNALAAVIKQKQFQYLEEFEELEQIIENTEIPKAGSVFYKVFRDAKYYPGDRVEKMIAQQIGPSKAYLEMINKFDSNFAIPPLHIDLAIAMNRSFFRSGTTFDNRQWMDIRGVGSGATGIEYLERGAHLERNVLAHEYAHLYHGRILTDEESRKIRALYHQAKVNNTTLDYYAANNESEFFAQGYAGFLSEKKVHPLNHKSMNTREYIKGKDADFYDFLEELLAKQEVYLAGNKKVLADNWAQTYLALAKRGRGRDLTLASSYLDTSLTYSSTYLPSILEYSQVYAQKGDFKKAEEYIKQAEVLDATYAPIYLSAANIVHYKVLADEINFEDAIAQQEVLFEKAKSLEMDLAELASLNALSRTRYYEYGHLAEAVKTAQDYAANAPTISTYLRDRKEAAEAYANNVRSELGYSSEVESFFKSLLDQNPQNFNFRLNYADVLMRQQKWDMALSVLEEGQRILSSAGNELPSYTLRIAHIHSLTDNEKSAKELLSDIKTDRFNWQEKLLFAEVLAELGEVERGFGIVEEVGELKLPSQKAEKAFVLGKLEQSRGNHENAISHYREALENNAYHLQVRALLINLLNNSDMKKEAEALTRQANALEIPLGSDFKAMIK